MRTNILMRSLAIVAVIAFTVWNVADAEKVNNCCKRVSRSVVNETITNYRLQKKNLPCVKAVIFYTEKGQLCVDPSQPRVREKIIAFRNSQQNKAATTPPSPLLKTSVPPNSTIHS